MKKSPNISLYFFGALYLIVHFIPDFEGADVMGAQWLYTSIVDLLALIFISINYKSYKDAIRGVFSIPFTLVYGAFLLWALGSYFYAINGTEALVCLARLVSTFLIFMNLSILLYKDDVESLFEIISLFVAVVLLVDASKVIIGFSQKVGDMPLDNLVLSLMGNNGNKNVMAASLLIKFPFVLYYIIKGKIPGKVIGLLSLLIGVFALFILNTRSTFVGLFLILLIYIFTTIIYKRKILSNSSLHRVLLSSGILFITIGLLLTSYILFTKTSIIAILLTLIVLIGLVLFLILIKSTRSIFTQLAFFVIPVIIAFFFANLVLDNALKLNDSQGNYGTVAKRVGDITISKGSDRLHLWSSAIDYFTKHPVIGGGYGNWKLASIPYEKEFTNDLFVPYHSHNDFLETFADLGVIGGLLYLGLFFLVFLFTLRIWFNKQYNKYHFIATISFMAITCYFVDAFLNFPTERTSMQTMLAFSAALVFAPFSLLISKNANEINKNEKIANGKNGVKLPNNTSATNPVIPILFLVFSFLMIVPSVFINKQVYQSLKVQKFVMGEIDADPKMALDEVKDAFPYFPNLSTSTLPIKALVARYYYRDKMYDESLRLLRECEKDNPYLYYTDFIKTAVFASKQDFDSVSYYSKRAFYNWPRATSYYKNVIFAAARKKDTAEINKAFATYIKYRNEPEGWNQYLLGRFELIGANDKLSLKLLDSTAKLFPNDSTTFSRIRGLFANSGAAVAPASTDYLTRGIKAFQKGQYTTAAQLYLKASEVDPNNYTNYENVGICYYSAKQFDKAIPYFQKASSFTQANTGKSEFYLAMCYISKGIKDKACNALQMAKQKKYPNVDQYISANCK
jgi:O-antigen ligase